MSEQSSTTTNTPAEPLLCKMGCGFFGNTATGNCCSKCWREMQKKNGNNNNNNNSGNNESPSSPPQTNSSTASTVEPAPMDVDTCIPAASVSPTPQQQPRQNQNEVNAKPAAPEATTTEEPKVVKKKKKKKTSYKSMMANMTKRADEKDIEKEKEGLRKVTGGGAFSKIDKI